VDACGLPALRSFACTESDSRRRPLPFLGSVAQIARDDQRDLWVREPEMHRGERAQQRVAGRLVEVHGAGVRAPPFPLRGKRRDDRAGLRLERRRDVHANGRARLRANAKLPCRFVERIVVCRPAWLMDAPSCPRRSGPRDAAGASCAPAHALGRR